MQELNLTATTPEQIRIKEYLELNVSDTLAKKINNGVSIEKDNKILINKKDLNGFIKFACDEARKLSDKGASSACIDDATVFGWAIHYFEENTIEGTLYNEDGTEYKAKPEAIPPKVKHEIKPKSNQCSLFDLPEETETDEAAIDTPNDKLIITENMVIDAETGEVLEEHIDKASKEILVCLQALFGNLIAVR